MFLHELPGAVWDKVPVAEARQHYNLLTLSDDSVDLPDMFGDEPEYFLVHRGDLVIDGGVRLVDDFSTEISTLYAIDGDLTVSGPLSLGNLDSNSSLVVTGSLHAPDLIATGHGQLFVSGSLTVPGLLVTGLADAGHLVVHGTTTVGAWIEVNGRGAIYLTPPQNARLIGSPDNCYFGDEETPESPQDALLAEFIRDGRPDTAAIAQAIRDRRPVLR
ncbi:hypothetical protein GCM10009682_45110 [Luedemannella flava]|uniref:Uncharacterized protein n=1 Tax=Luedemannella flava TaxID=349316 RepID=A0ABP4YJB7_9ACTN